MTQTFPADAYHWRAEYADGSTLDEHSIEGGLPFAAIDQSRLSSLVLLANYRHLGNHRLVLLPGQRIIFYRTRTLTIPLDASGLKRTSVTTLGWQETVQTSLGARNNKRLWHFGDDGSIFEDEE